MTNYGETLTYWYLRLNGFFPLTNFVLHRDPDIEHAADVDLLAVRFKHVYETIGGQPQDWHDWFQNNNLILNGNVIGLIVEVKTGGFDSEKIRNSFSTERLRAAIKRFGFFQEERDIQTILSGLRYRFNQPEQLDLSIVSLDGFQIGKMLVTSESIILNNNYPRCLQITLTEIEEFIMTRMNNYAESKQPDRIRFPDELIQYFAWKAQNRHPRNAEA